MATYRVIGIGEKNKFFDVNAYHDVIRYIFNPQSASFIGGSGVKSLNTAADEMMEIALLNGKEKRKKLRHSLLSFDASEHVTPVQAADFAERIIQYYAPTYQIVYAVHSNTDNVHIHFVMNHVSFVDGKLYTGNRGDYYGFQRYMKRTTHLPIRLVKDRKNGA